MLTRKFHSTHPLLLAAGVSIAATLASYFFPEDHSASVVGLIFLTATYLLALPRDAVLPPAHFGLSLGGLMETTPLSVVKMAKESWRAIWIATLVALIVFPPFWFGFRAWYQPVAVWDWSQALSVSTGTPALTTLSNLALGHLLIVALPEEAFFRGYLQTVLDDRWKRRFSFLGARVGYSIVIVSLLFALGHFATTGAPGRLAVFFPSLLFGYLRARTGGIGAPMILHAQCNIFAALLGQGYGLY